MTFRLFLAKDVVAYRRQDGSIDVDSYRRDRFAQWTRLRQGRRPWKERIRATLGGYYWLPCPICGRDYGGHEKPNGSLEGPVGSGHTVCGDPRCILDAFYRSREVHRALGPGCDLLVDDAGVTAWALRELGETLRP